MTETEMKQDIKKNIGYWFSALEDEETEPWEYDE